MLFPDEDAASLKTWIVKRLENTSDADADVLADYVLALLRHDGPVDHIRQVCAAEIPDFLQEDTTVFLDDLFATIAHKSYLPGAPPAPKLALPPHQPPPQQFHQQQQPSAQLQPSAPSFVPAEPIPDAPQYPSGSRKRAYYDRGDVDPQGGHAGGRAMKQPRRQRDFGPPGVDMSTMHPPLGPKGQLPPGVNMNVLPPMGPQGQVPFDPMAMMQAFAQQGYGGRGPGLPPPFAGVGRGQPLRRGRCRDFDAQGFCTRGFSCKFDHIPRGSFDAPPPPAPPFDAYDPTNSTLVLPDNKGQVQGQIHMGFPQLPTFPMDPWRMQFPMDGNQWRPSPRNRGRRSQLSFEGPVNDRSKTTIVVENIPEEKFTEEEVRSFFSQFGPIVSVSMRPYKRLALVKYETWNSANAAYRSPRVIFDNRFVRVFWYKDGDGEPPASAPVPRENGGAGNGVGHTNGGASEPNGDYRHAEPPEVDMEEFRRKQEEAQQAYEEKKRKKEELERKQQELEQLQKDLFARQNEARRELKAKLAKVSGSEAAKYDSSPEITLATLAPPDPSKPVSDTTKALRATLAALENEARSLGLDPSESAPGFRGRGGGYRGRGRGGPPPYASFPPRGGFRGGYRGRGRGNNHAAYAMFSLDHRPKRVAVSGVNFSTPEKDECLRQYLLGIGEFTDVDITPEGVAQVSFNDRRTAEAFYYGLQSAGREIPGIVSPVELAWIPNPTTTVKAAPAPVAAANGNDGKMGGRSAGDGEDPDEEPYDDDTAMDAVEDGMSPPRQREVSMDYDVADEDWDVA